MATEEKRLPQRLRAEVLLRDFATCQECGFKSLNGKGMHVHHIISRESGGSDDIENLLTLCRPCHQDHHRPGEVKEEPKVRSVRLDSDVWEAVRGMGCSLNRYLRSNLLGEMRVSGVQGTVQMDAERKSATVNLVTERKPLLKPSERKGIN